MLCAGKSDAQHNRILVHGWMPKKILREALCLCCVGWRRSPDRRTRQFCSFKYMYHTVDYSTVPLLVSFF